MLVWATRLTLVAFFFAKKMPERGTQASRKRILQFFNQNLQLTNTQ